ncbi:unnamed protein product [Sphenostylis stenocarpa]|uniref:Uncharacterized protein n=1 Tax=Sphenostylis stenocarpa TaxID=92480 RepID=A0AA86V800_9FABA|nr:unnamed protein product [Sphenostylis stenocarpa]
MAPATQILFLIHVTTIIYLFSYCLRHFHLYASTPLQPLRIALYFPFLEEIRKNVKFLQ